ncbi:hypothetical protein ACNQR7_32410 [Mycolicibacterium senegalense]|uniref:hypothetical protein n=1 Tax=Mycobacteriaceae TaxID=1762 RepID=UPI003AACBA7C
MFLLTMRHEVAEPSVLGSVYLSCNRRTEKDQPCFRPLQHVSAIFGEWPGRKGGPGTFFKNFAQSIIAARPVSQRA